MARNSAPTPLRDLYELTKPRLAGLVVFTAGTGMLLAPGEVDHRQAVLALLLTTLVVASGTVLNMYLERDVDHLMERTRDRPLPAGRMAPRVALGFGIALGVVSLPLMALLVNPLTAGLGLLALLMYLGLYTPLKRRSVAAVYVGAFPGATPILMGWTAVTGSLDPAALALFAILFLWQIPHFIAISLFRREEYAAAGLKTLPHEYGNDHSLWHMVGSTVGLVVATLLPILYGLAGTLYTATALVLAVLSIAGTLWGVKHGAGAVWARRYFFVTLLYLPLLLGVLVADRV